jgi:hypothetical protein
MPPWWRGRRRGVHIVLAPDSLTGILAAAGLWSDGAGERIMRA